MSKIAVTPREGLTVKDHNGKVIPAGGALVEDSPVLQRRLREGLLVEGLPESGTQEPEGMGDSDEGTDIDKMTVPELKARLGELEIEFDPAAKKADLKAALEAHLESTEDEE